MLTLLQSSARCERMCEGVGVKQREGNGDPYNIDIIKALGAVATHAYNMADCRVRFSL